MAVNVKASASVTLSTIRDISSVTWYYLLQASTAAAPAKPTASPPTGSWTDSEPSYNGGDTKSLYVTERTVYTDGTFEYSAPHLSSSYEAAKAAWTLANNASGTAAKALEQSIEYITGTQTAATGAWTGKTADAALKTGKTIAYKLPYAGSGNATLNLTLSGGGTTGAKEVYWNTTRVTTHYPAGSVIKLTYDGSVWRADNYNSDTVNRTRLQNVIIAAEAITASHVIVGTSAGYRDIAAGVAFDITYPVLWAGTTIAKGATSGTRDNNYLQINGVNLATSKSGWTGTNGSTVYIVGSLVGNTFTVDGAVFTTAVPTSADGKFYIPIGLMYSTTQCYFNSSNRLYAYLNGKFQAVDMAAKGLADTAQSTADTASSRATYHYGTCATAAGSTAKVVTLSGFTLYTGAIITVKFTNGNTSAAPTLNVNGTGAKSVIVNNVTTGLASKMTFPANTTASFMYNGSQWQYTGSDNLLNEFEWTESGGLIIRAKSGSNSRVNITNAAVDIYDTNGKLGTRVNDAGMTVYKDGEMVSQFGDTVYIGNNTGKNSYFEIQKQKITGYNYRKSQYFAVGDTSNQEFTLTYTTVAGTTSNGGKYGQSDLLEDATISRVTVDGVENTDWYRDSQYSPPHRGITFPISSPPGEGKELIIYYKFTGLTPFFTFNNRKADSHVGKGSFSEGASCAAEGYYSHAEGCKTNAKGFYSHAEGEQTTAWGYHGGHAEGYMTVSYDAHAEGGYTEANGTYSHAEGYHTEASGRYSHASGEWTYAGEPDCFVIGKYNKFAESFERGDDGRVEKRTYHIGAFDYSFVIGGGTSDDDRKNILSVDWSGNLYIPLGSKLYCNDPGTLWANVEKGSYIGYCYNNGDAHQGCLGYDARGTGAYHAFWVNGAGVFYINDSAVQCNKPIRDGSYKLLTRATVSKDNVSYAKTSTTETKFTVAKTGYTPVGLVGFDLDNASSSGTGLGNCVVVAARLDGTNALFQIRNNGSAAAKLKLNAYVLYISNTQGL